MSSASNLLTTIVSREEVHAQMHWVYRDWAGGNGPHWDDFFEAPSSVFFVEKGRVELEFEDGRSVCCQAGDIFLGVRSVRKQRIGANTKLLSVGYDLTWATRHSAYDHVLNVCVPAKVVAKNASCRRLRVATLRLLKRFYPDRREIDFVSATHLPPSDAGDAIRQQLAFWEWLGHLQRVFDDQDLRPAFPMARSEIVREVKDRVDRYPLSSPFKDIAKDLGLSVSWRRVQQLFKAELHQAPHDYFDARRIDHARRHLRQRGASVKEVAAELGFRSLSHFSVWFKKGSGVSPRQFLAGS
ncbi:MAG: helix-turn-helix transcriptional regulator [Rariglobus sp.]